LTLILRYAFSSHSQMVGRDNATATSIFGFISNLAMAVNVVNDGIVFQNGMGSRTDMLRRELRGFLEAESSGGEALANVISLGLLAEHVKGVISCAYMSAFVFAYIQCRVDC